MSRRLLAGMLVLAAFGATAPAAAHAQWRAEPVPSAGALGLLDLAFDSRGRGLLTSEGFEQAGARRFTAVHLRSPADGWEQAPDLAGVGWGGAEVHLYGRARALLVARQIAATNRFGDSRQRLVYAPGRSDGGFQPLRTIAEDAAEHVSAVNRAGDGLVAFRDRAGRAFVADRRAHRGFGRPRALKPGGAGAVAINDAGTRVVAWWALDGVYARLRAPGGRWGTPVRVAAVRPTSEARLRATIAPSGQIVLAWHKVSIGEDIPLDITAGVAIRPRGSGWRSFRLERSRDASGGPYLVNTQAIQVVGSGSRAYVTWTGISHGSPVVKLARITTAGPRDRTVLSGGITGAAVDDATAGPGQSLAVSWSAMTDYRTVLTYASLRRGEGRWAAPARLTPDGANGLTGSRVAFQPLTGEAVVAYAYVPGSTGAIQASVSPPG